MIHLDGFVATRTLLDDGTIQSALRASVLRISDEECPHFGDRGHVLIQGRHGWHGCVCGKYPVPFELAEADKALRLRRNLGSVA